MKKDYEFIEGEVLLFNKPLHWTSFQLVNKVRWLIKRELQVKKIKVGHAGTLDPLATGMMILCTGKKTKEIVLYQAAEKEYIATIKLGAITPSYDGETAENYFFATKHINEALIKKALLNFLGAIEQEHYDEEWASYSSSFAISRCPLLLTVIIKLKKSK